MPTVSVIVPTYRRSESLAGCLQPLLEDPATTELIVVVDGNDEDAANVVRSLASVDKRAILVLVPHGGKRHALAAGLEKATAEIVLLIDDDVVSGAGLVSGHAQRHHATEGLVVVGYMPCWDAPLGEGVARLTRSYAVEYEEHCSQYEKDPSLVLPKLWGGNVSLRRSDCIVVGFTPWSYRHEDQEFGLRCLRTGLSGVFDRKLHAQHHHTRDASHFLAEARAFAAGTACLHERFADIIGPFDPDYDLRGCGRAVCLVACRVVRPLAWHLPARHVTGLMTTPLVAVARVASRLNLGWVEGQAFSIAAWIEAQIGLRQYRNGEA
jgi:hypothetical protein